MDGWITTAASPPYAPTAGLTVAPGAMDLDDINVLWKALTTSCEMLSIMWTDGDVDAFNNLRWYGIQADGTVTDRANFDGDDCGTQHNRGTNLF